MKYFAFISRHQPTPEQHALANEMGVELHSIGDADAFTVDESNVHDASIHLGIVFDDVVVVHPAAALRLVPHFDVGIFENGQRPVVGGPPQFVAKAFHIFKRHI